MFLIVLNVVFWCFSISGGILGKNYTQSTGDLHNNKAKDLSYWSSKICQNIYGSLTPRQIARFADASGKPGSGIYGGNTLWYGSYSECKKLPYSRYCWTMFPGNIFMVKNNSQVRLVMLLIRASYMGPY